MPIHRLGTMSDGIGDKEDKEQTIMISVGG